MGSVGAQLFAHYSRDCSRFAHGHLYELRKFIERLRTLTGVPLPLAHEWPFVSGRNLLHQAQVEAGLGAESCLIAVANDQLILTPTSQSFVQKVVWSDDIATG